MTSQYASPQMRVYALKLRLGTKIACKAKVADFEQCGIAVVKKCIIQLEISASMPICQMVPSGCTTSKLLGSREQAVGRDRAL